MNDEQLLRMEQETIEMFVNRMWPGKNIQVDAGAVWSYQQRKINTLITTCRATNARANDLSRFKAYVHQRLDEAGIPTHPHGPHSAAGCRVGDRLDIALAGAATPALTAAAWVPVGESLPEEDSVVLVYSYNSMLVTALRPSTTAHRDKWVEAWGWNPVAGVTHWMPLPQPPVGAGAAGAAAAPSPAATPSAQEKP